MDLLITDDDCLIGDAPRHPPREGIEATEPCGEKSNHQGPITPAFIKRIWVVDGHPLSGSFGSALAASYVSGAQQAGRTVRLTRLRDLEFAYSPTLGPIEPDLHSAQECLEWCNHMVVLYPNWWGTYPALFKAFIDRLLILGFAFEIQDKGWKGLLSGRSAQIITTMDTPLWVYRWLLGSPGTRAMVRATLGFCGIRPVHVKLVGPVHASSPSQRDVWLAQIFHLGQSIDEDFRTSAAARLQTWLSIARLQFYFFPLLVMAAGALAGASSIAQPVRVIPVLLAAGCVFLLEFLTVLTNELEDQETDTRNRHAGAFTGGSRVLVEGRLASAEVRRVRGFVLFLLIVFAGGLTLMGASSMLVLGCIILLGLVLGHQYSAKPLQLSYRSWGEVDVAFTHSFLVAGLGWASQSAAWNPHHPWGFVSAIFAAVLPSIILAGFPDREADLFSGKNTLVVRWGVRPAAYAAIVSTAVAVILKIMTNSGGPLSFWLSSAAVVHGFALMIVIGKFSHRNRDGKIDGLLVFALTFMLWFGLEPFLAFWATTQR